MRNKLKYIFAQPLIGGMAIGFEESLGYPPEAIITTGIANDLHYINYQNATHNKNIPVIYMESDYETFQSKEDEILYNRICKDIDIFGHVAICSGLSQMNSSNSGSKARGDANNEQNQNMYALNKLGMRMGAKVVVFENAPGAYTKSGEGTIENLKETASEYEYSTHLVKTNTLFHGIPQSRNRTFLMFYKNSNPGLFKYQNKERTSLKEYLKLIPEDSLHDKDYIQGDQSALGHLYQYILNSTNTDSFLDAIDVIDPDKKKATWTAAQITEILGFNNAISYFENKINEAQDSTEIQELEKVLSQVKHYKFKRDDGKSFWDNTTILANRGEFTNAIVGKSLTSMVNPLHERAYSIREMLHLMGHPHDFFLENHTSNWNHICQNVPVKTSSYIADQITLFLLNELELSDSVFVKQDNTKQRVDVG